MTIQCDVPVEKEKNVNFKWQNSGFLSIFLQNTWWLKCFKIQNISIFSIFSICFPDFSDSLCSHSCPLQTKELAQEFHGKFPL